MLDTLAPWLFWGLVIGASVLWALCWRKHRADAEEERWRESMADWKRRMATQRKRRERDKKEG